MYDLTALEGPIATRSMHHAGIVVTDLDRSVEFYTRAFGAEVELRIDDMRDPRIAEMHELDDELMSLAILRIGETRFELVRFTEPEGRPNDRRGYDVGVAHLAFAVDDVEDAYARLSAAGVHFGRPPVHMTEGPATGLVLAYARDPDGIQVELIGQEPAPSS